MIDTVGSTLQKILRFACNTCPKTADRNVQKGAPKFVPIRHHPPCACLTAFDEIPGLLSPFLHTASDQKLEPESLGTRLLDPRANLSSVGLTLWYVCNANGDS